MNTNKPNRSMGYLNMTNIIKFFFVFFAMAASSAFAGDVDMAFFDRNGHAVESSLSYTEDNSGFHIKENLELSSLTYRDRVLDLLPTDRSTEVTMTIDGSQEEVVVLVPISLNGSLIFRGWIESRGRYLFWR